MLSPGSLFAADYEIESELAAGGMGAVYVVVQKSTGRKRALKIMHRDLVREPKLRERFALEAQIGARIDSEHVIEVIAAGVAQETGEPYLVMELLEGDTLDAELERRGALAPAEALEILRQLFHALSAAHAAAVVHRDLKPENVFLSKSKRADVRVTVKVLDFGIAKLVAEAHTQRTDQIGTPLWMAPEQTEPNAPVSPATDVWALGLIAFRMLAGKPYWLGATSSSAQGILREVLIEPMVPAAQRAAALGGAALPFGFDGWFARATARKPEERFSDAAAAFAALEPLLGAPAPAPAPPGATVVGAPLQAALEAPRPPAGLTAPSGPHESAFEPAFEPVGTSGPQAPAPTQPPQPYGAPPPPPPAAKPAASLWSRYWPIALGLAAVAGAGTFAMTRSPNERPRASREEDEDDRRPRPGASASSSAARGGGDLGASPGAVPVELFVMSQCPYAVQTENVLGEVVQKLGPDMALTLSYIGTTSSSGELSSMHGPAEVMGDRVQLCAAKTSKRWFDLVLCQNESTKQIDTNWRDCAAKLGIPADPIAKCIETESDKLLADSFAHSQDRGARGSPTIYVGGQKYEGRRTVADFTRAICNAHAPPVPTACADIPVVPPVNVTLLADARCTECITSSLESQVRSRLASPVLKTLDYGTPEGKALYEAIKPLPLPALVFDASLDGDPEAVKSFERGLKTAGKYRVVTTGSWSPLCADAGGCAKDECKELLFCRPETPKQLDLYLMSQCPYAAKGLLALKEVTDNFQRSGERLDIRLHYIGSGDVATGLSSMHGQGEVDEDLRAVCAIDAYPRNNKFLEYVTCRAKSYKDTAWEGCATSSGMDVAKIRACSTGDQGKRLLAASFAASSAAGMSASPTWVTNGRYKFSGIDAETIKTKICERNTLGGCSARLSSTPPTPTP